jgi:hypothetical protein
MPSRDAKAPHPTFRAPPAADKILFPLPIIFSSLHCPRVVRATTSVNDKCSRTPARCPPSCVWCVSCVSCASCVSRVLCVQALAASGGGASSGGGGAGDDHSLGQPTPTPSHARAAGGDAEQKSRNFPRQPVAACEGDGDGDDAARAGVNAVTARAGLRGRRDAMVRRVR